jgi:hypothetical protein
MAWRSPSESRNRCIASAIIPSRGYHRRGRPRRDPRARLPGADRFEAGGWIWRAQHSNQGMQENQQIVFLSDGGEDVPCCDAVGRNQDRLALATVSGAWPRSSRCSGRNKECFCTNGRPPQPASEALQKGEGGWAAFLQLVLIVLYFPFRQMTPFKALCDVSLGFLLEIWIWGRNAALSLGSVASARPSACGTLDTPATPKGIQSSGKIDGNSVPEPFRASSLHSRPSYQRAKQAAKEIPKRITFAAARP